MTGERFPSGSLARWCWGRGLLVGCVAFAATISVGCHGDHPGSMISVSDDGGDATDNQDAALTDVSTDATGGSDTELDQGSADQRDQDAQGDRDASDGSLTDAADAGAPAPLCVGLGKVEDPLGCSGARICDGAGNCASRYTVFAVTRLNPATPAQLTRIITGPAGKLWFTDGDAVGSMDLNGDSHEIAMPGSLDDIASGPDGNLWFTDGTNRVVGRVTPDGAQMEFPRVAGQPTSPYGIVAGPDGSLWFADLDGIGRMTTAGALTMVPVPTAVPYATWIAVGADGNLWFTEQVGKVGRITIGGGAITEFPLPETGLTATSSLAFGIAAGPDGNLWFAEPEPNKIGRISPAGVVTAFPLPTPGSLPSHIAAGPDGNLWFIENFANQIGRITPSGTITEFVPPTPDAVVVAIARGPDGAIWFTEDGPTDVGAGEPHLGWLVRMQP